MIFDLRKTEDGIFLFTFSNEDSWWENEKSEMDGVDKTMEDYLSAFIHPTEPIPKYVEDCTPFRMIIRGEILTPDIRTVVREVELKKE